MPRTTLPYPTRNYVAVRHFATALLVVSGATSFASGCASDAAPAANGDSGGDAASPSSAPSSSTASNDASAGDGGPVVAQGPAGVLNETQQVIPAAALRPSDWSTTKDYVDSYGHVPWVHPNVGDWTDANGVANGPAPFAQAAVPNSGTTQPIALDVTAIVKRWRDGAANSGFLLRALAGSGIVKCASREAGANAASLELALADGTTRTIAVSADTHLVASTASAVGGEDTFEINTDGSALLWFDLDAALANAPAVTSATLKMLSTKQYDHDSQVAVFAVDLSAQQVPTPLLTGIASKGFDDATLSADPDVLHFERFSALPSRATGWIDDPSDGQPITIVGDTDPDPALRYEPLRPGIPALKITIPKGWADAYANRWPFWKNTGSEPDEIYIRYYVRFADNWDPGPDGGKLPGIDGTYLDGSQALRAARKPDAPPYSGNGGRMSLGTTGWSMRGGFDATPGAGASPLADAGYRGYRYYGYATDWHVRGETAYGVAQWWNRSALGLMKKNEWHCIEHYLKLNSVDTTGATQVFVGDHAWSDAYTDGVHFYASASSPLRGTDTAIVPLSQLFFGNKTGLLYPSATWATSPGGQFLNDGQNPTDTEVHTSPGVGRQDGVLRSYVDGRLAFEDPHFRMRHLANVQVFAVWLSLQHGGTGPAAKDASVYIADLAVSKSYVGPMKVK